MLIRNTLRGIQLNGRRFLGTSSSAHLLLLPRRSAAATPPQFLGLRLGYVNAPRSIQHEQQRKMSSPPEVSDLDSQMPANPLDGFLLNKVDTEQEALLEKHPTYDGRGIVMAIIDTGVDPSLPGMQVTSTGARKLIDCVDCTGAGDVETSTIRSVADGKVEGLTGRTLTIPSSWKNPTGKFHLGIKPIHELYTKSLKNTLMEEKNDEYLRPTQNQAAADALRLLTAHETDIGGTSDKTADKWDREDHASKVEFLRSMQNVSEVGPVADVLVWHDGDTWKACLDTSFRGRLNLAKVMGSFRETGEHDILTSNDSVVYTFRIANDGNLVEVVVPSGAHGSHVANIAAANYPDSPKQNGCAPGVQLVSMNIGDIRLSAMETGQAMIRAFNLCAELGVHVLNMSFGEGTHFPDQGRVTQEARDLVQKHGTIFVCSAGNAGPALSTVGAPGGTTTGVIGIGAYLTETSVDTLYGVHNTVDSNIYPWSSRGPCPDGKLGVALCAPAAAFADVPQYCRQSRQMMNGTSMSSPNAAGSIACMLSGLQEEKIVWTNFYVRQALETTAHPLANSDHFSSGYGMIKVLAAFEKVKRMLAACAFPPRLTHFDVGVSRLNKKSQGIYIREPRLDQLEEFNLTIVPHFAYSDEHAEQIRFEKQCMLECNAPWVNCPQTFLAVGQERTLFVTVDASKAQPGVNYTEIVALDMNDGLAGALFRIPVTVIVPEKVEDVARGYSTRLKGHSGVPERRFIAVPQYVTSVEVKLHAVHKEPLDRFTIHTVYMEDERCPRHTESCKLYGPVGDEWSKVIKVRGGKTLEVCVVRSWSRGKEPADVELQLNFHGVKTPEEFSLVHGTCNSPFRVQASPIRSFEISPNITLKSLVVPHKATSTKIEPLGSRDITMTGMQINRLLITYKISVSKTCDVRLELPGLTPYLYESPIDCVLFQVFGGNKSFVSASGAYPDRYTHKLEKGEYTVQAQLRHPEEAILEKFRDVPMLVHMKLPTDIDVPVYVSAEAAVLGKDSKWSGKGLMPNEEATFYAGCIAEDKIAKNILATGSGSYLLGDMTIFKDSTLKVDKTAVNYWLSELSVRPSKALSMVTAKKPDVDQNTEMKDAMRDLQISWIGKLKDENAASELFKSCRETYPTHLPLLTARIKQIMSRKLAEQNPDAVKQAIGLAAEVLDMCNPKEVLQFVGIRQDHADDLLTIDKWNAFKAPDDPPATLKTLQGLEEQKAAILVALQVLATCELDWKLRTSPKAVPASLRYGAFTPNIFGGKSEPIQRKTVGEDVKAVAATIDAATQAAFDELQGSKEKDPTGMWYVKLLVWLAADDPKVALISAKHAALHGHWGRCAKLLHKSAEEIRAGAGDSRAVDVALAEVCDELGWVHLSNHFHNVMLVKNRNAFRPF